MKYIVFALLILSFLNTAILIKMNQKLSQFGSSPNSSQALESLPEGFPKEKLDEFFEEFKKSFNSDSDKDFFNLFSKWSRAQMKEQEITSNYQNLKGIFGDVLEATYSHFEIEGKQGQRTFVIFNYITKTSAQETPVFLKLGIHWDGEEYGVYRAFLSL